MRRRSNVERSLGCREADIDQGWWGRDASVADDTVRIGMRKSGAASSPGEVCGRSPARWAAHGAWCAKCV
jgi:hypothetical protein